MKHTHYELAKDLIIEIGVTSEITWLKSNERFGGWVPVELNPISKPRAGVNVPWQVDYTGSSSEFVGLRVQRILYPNEYNKNPAATGDIQLIDDFVNILKITVKVSSSGKYKTPSIEKRVFSVARGSSFTWQEDFIFELKEAPNSGWLPSGVPNLVKAGSFALKDDDSLELELVPKGSVPLPLLSRAGTENFMSGYREVGESSALFMLPYIQSLNSTPGQYFIVKAASNLSDPYLPRIYAYRDDRSSLLFWNRGTGASYRVVPFSTGGVRKLTSAVTKGRLLDAVALPKNSLTRPTWCSWI